MKAEVQFLETSQDDVGSIAHGVVGEFDRRRGPQHLAQYDARFQSGERRAEAVVQTKAEAEVGVALTLQHYRGRRVEGPWVAIGGADQDEDE